MWYVVRFMAIGRSRLKRVGAQRIAEVGDIGRYRDGRM
jgi:hypothetical protein